MSINRELYNQFFKPVDDSPESRRVAAEAKRRYGHFLAPESAPQTLAERLSDEWRRLWKRRGQRGDTSGFMF
jgi:hypothetical protein